MEKILFQGDSITDATRTKCGRPKEDETNLGTGYALMVSGELTSKYPEKYTILNRGVSGNRIVDLYARVKEDIINLQPDVLSILIGVNDVWHEFKNQNGVSADKYYKIYSMLIEEIKKALPEVKIIIMEPFSLNGTVTEAFGEEFQKEVKKRAEKAKAIAEKYDLIFVPLQDKLNELSQIAPSSHWLFDGVHPTDAGHTILKNEWLSHFLENNL